MERTKKKFQRFQTQAQQTLLGAERTDVLHSVTHVEDRVQRMHKAIKDTSEKLSHLIRSPSAKDDGEKRKKKANEYALAKTLSDSAKELDTGHDTNLLGQVMGRYGEAMNFVVSEMVKMEQDVDNGVVVRFNKFAEEVQQIRVLRDRMKKLTLDLDHAKGKLAAAKESQAEKEKIDSLQDSADSAMNKVESCKDTLVAEMYTLAAKEVDVAQLFTLLIEYQVEYYRTVARVLSDTLPEIQRKIATHSHRPVFGCPLEDHLRYTGREIALVLEVCCCSLLALGLEDEGIFRISGNAVKVRRLRAMFDAGEVELADYDRDPHAVAGSLKSYLRDLPEPLMTHGLLKEWTAAGNLDGEARKKCVIEVLGRLPRSNYCNLRYLIKFLAKVVSHSEVNRMSIYNVAIVIGPNLLWNKSDGDNFLGSRLVECLLTDVDYFFPGDVQYKSEMIDSLNDRTGGFTPSNVQVKVRKGSPGDRMSVSMHASETGDSTPKRPKAPAPPPPRQTPKAGVIAEESPSVPHSSNSSPDSKRSFDSCSLQEFGSSDAIESEYAVPPDDPPPSDPPPHPVVYPNISQPTASEVKQMEELVHSVTEHHPIRPPPPSSASRARVTERPKAESPTPQEPQGGPIAAPRKLVDNSDRLSVQPHVVTVNGNSQPSPTSPNGHNKPIKPPLPAKPKNLNEPEFQQTHL